jgi:hypothetical protein
MARLKSATATLAGGVMLGALVAVTPAASQTPESGGVMNVMQREDLPQGFSIHETATISTVWPGMPCFTNLVLCDPLEKIESVDTIVGEWPSAGRGRTAIATRCSSSARTRSGTTASSSPRRT